MKDKLVLFSTIFLALFGISAIVVGISYYSKYQSRNVANFKFDLSKIHDEHQENKFFDHCDVKHRTFLTVDLEFKIMIASLFTYNEKSYQVSDEHRHELFKLLDFNHDGKIDREEFKKLWQEWIALILKPRSALVVVDVQNDFISGPLNITNLPAHHKGYEVVPVINELIRSVHFDLVIYTYDHHPANHCSFIENIHLRKILTWNGKSVDESFDKSVIKTKDNVTFEKYPNITQMLWPKHCVQDTPGEGLHQDMIIEERIGERINKGTDPDVDSYSAFYDNGNIHQTNMDQVLQKHNITDIYTTGLLLDLCVGFTSLDGIKLGYRTSVIEDATRGGFYDKMKDMKSQITNLFGVIVNARNVSDMVKSNDRRFELGMTLAKKNYDKRKAL